MGRTHAQTALNSGKRFLTAGGVETYLMFQQGFPLRQFAAFEVFADDQAFAKLIDRHLRPVADAALRGGFGLILDCMVYKASPDALSALGYGADDLARVNRNAVEHMGGFAASWRAESGDAARALPILTVADLGPRGDGYGLGDDEPLSVEAARAYHRQQIAALVAADVDLLAAYTQTNVNEAVGIALAAKELEAPILISATVETDGHLPDGTPLGDFIERVDAATGGYPLFYMVNCAHPLHLEPTLTAAATAGAAWLSRFRGVRANASSKSHEELDNSPELDRGDPADFGKRLAALAHAHSLCVMGGCCGTDAEHIEAAAAHHAIAEAKEAG